MRHFSENSGISIVADQRLQDKLQMAISIDFRGDVSVECALRVVADMADLGIVLLDGGVYVTTPANAEALEKKLRHRRREVEERTEAGAH